VDNNINNNFNEDIMAMVFNILTLTTALTTISSNFFYNNYSVKYFITLNRLILIKTAKNIVIFINNNAFIYGLTGGIKLSGTEPGTVKSNNKGKSTTYFCNNNNNNINIENLIVNINFFNYYFDDNR
jgi:hypothetical protein